LWRATDPDQLAGRRVEAARTETILARPKGPLS
jgi:hypothetical protein